SQAADFAEVAQGRRLIGEQAEDQDDAVLPQQVAADLYAGTGVPLPVVGGKAAKGLIDEPLVRPVKGQHHKMGAGRIGLVRRRRRRRRRRGGWRLAQGIGTLLRRVRGGWPGQGRIFPWGRLYGRRSRR